MKSSSPEPNSTHKLQTERVHVKSLTETWNEVVVPTKTLNFSTNDHQWPPLDRRFEIHPFLISAQNQFHRRSRTVISCLGFCQYKRGKSWSDENSCLHSDFFLFALQFRFLSRTMNLNFLLILLLLHALVVLSLEGEKKQVDWIEEDHRTDLSPKEDISVVRLLNLKLDLDSWITRTYNRSRVCHSPRAQSISNGMVCIAQAERRPRPVVSSVVIETFQKWRGTLNISNL